MKWELLQIQFPSIYVQYGLRPERTKIMQTGIMRTGGPVTGSQVNGLPSELSPWRKIQSTPFEFLR